MRRTTVRALSVVLVLSVAGGCSTTSTSRSGSSSTAATTSEPKGSASTTSPAPTKAPVQVGDCLEPMTQPLAESHQLPALVACSEPHGGEVVAVHELRLGADAAFPASTRNLLGMDDEVRTCLGGSGAEGELGGFVGANELELELDAALRRSTGVTRAWSVSGLQAATYVPGPAAWAGGARWFVCAAVLSNSLDVPSSYSGSARGVRAQRGSLPEQFGWCKLQVSEDRRDYRSVSCAKPHNYEQLATFAAGGLDDAFPGEAALDKLGTTLCAPLSSLATKQRSDHLPAGIELGWTYPQAADWADGDRAVRCFAVTTTATSRGTVGLGTSQPG